MVQLLGNLASEHTSVFLKELFLQRLPPNVRMILASTPGNNTVQDLATLAEKIMEVTGNVPPSPINTVSAPDGQLVAELTKLREEVAHLKKLVQSNSRSPSRNCSHTHSRSPRSSSPSHAQQSTDLCWYHQRFGDHARQCREPCSRQSLMATSVTGQSTSSRLFRIYDPTTTYRFLVDTGAEVSVVTPTAADRKYRQELTLQAANSTPITTYGSRSLTLDLGLWRTFRWIFTVADVTIPILGADFLCHFVLVVDMGNHSLSDS